MVVTTLNDMVNEVLMKLQGYTMRQDRTTTVSASISATVTNIQVTGGTDSAIKGIIEIGDELIFVSNYFTTGVSDLMYNPVTRGYLGTTAATHATGDLVTISPTIPRVEVKRAINDTILAIFPKVWGTGSTTFSYSPAVNTYALPSSVNNVLSVSYKTYGSTKEWAPIRDWRVDPYADTSTFGTSNTVTLYSPVPPGSTVRVAYTAGPETLTNSFDDFSDTTGFQESVKDVVIFGACYRLLSAIDAGLTQYTSPENNLQKDNVPAGSATTAAKYFYALYQQRLTEEAEKLKSFYPVRVHFTR